MLGAYYWLRWHWEKVSRCEVEARSNEHVFNHPVAPCTERLITAWPCNVRVVANLRWEVWVEVVQC